MEDLYVFKIGGRTIDDTCELESFLSAFAVLPGKKILVHGGGIFADDLARKLGIPIQMHEGRRITSLAMRDLVSMVYGGLINKQIVAKLQKLGCDALGLTGADGGLLTAVKRPSEPIDFGMVGDIQSVRRDLLLDFLCKGLTPVIAPLSLDANGEILNSNADGVACALAAAFSESYRTHLLYCFDKPGVLLDANNPDSILSELNPAAYERMKQEKLLKDGILPKLESCFKAQAQGCYRVLLSTPDQSLRFLKGQTYRGTLIQA